MVSEPAVVLLICSDRDAAAQLAAVIQPRGHRIIATPFGPSAMSRAHDARLIVVDRVGGDTDASGAVRRFKGSPTLSSIPILAIAQGEDVDERIRLLEAGADDVVSRPVDALELDLRIEGLLMRAPAAASTDQAVVTTGEPPPGMSRLLAFISPKGGAGTTTLAVNTAMALALRSGRSVGLADLDLTWGQVTTHLDLRPRYSVVDIARDDAALDDPEVLRTYAERKDGLLVYGAPPRPDQADIIDEARFGRLLASLAAAHDITIVDGGSAFDGRTMNLFALADRVAIVVTPEIATLRAVHALLEVLSEYETTTEKRLFVLNHLFAEDLLSRDDVRRSLGDVTLVEVPHDGALFHKAANEGVPVILGAPRSVAAERLHRLATTLLGDVDAAHAPSNGARKLRLTGLLRRG